MVSLLRVARLLRSESLDAVAAALGIRKAWLSTIERYPQRHVSRSLQKRLEAHFNVPWATLAHTTDGGKLAAAILNLHVRQQKGMKDA
jgi:transcriptional regulator with XRE-family HTH domain